MTFEIKDRVEVLPSAFPPISHNGYHAYGTKDGSRLDDRLLKPGMRGTVFSFNAPAVPKIEFDDFPAGHANVQAVHLKKLDPLYGNEED